MPCYSPLKGWKAINGGFTGNYKGSLGLPLIVPCGQCIGCRLDHARRWAIRCMHEAKLYPDDQCYFATLTYSDENLPPNQSLAKEHLQLFWKRYRKKYHKIRYYASGEYGDTTQRPHYHALIYGHRLPDLIHYSDQAGGSLYTSSSLDSIWGLGHCMIGQITFESASYVARYATKKLTGKEGQAEYERLGLTPPFAVMSRRPGIGRGWYDRYTSDIYPSDEIVIREKYLTKPPRYYDTILQKENEVLYNTIKTNRLQKQKEKPLDDQTDSRLYAAHEAALSRLATTPKHKI